MSASSSASLRSSRATGAGFFFGLAQLGCALVVFVTRASSALGDLESSAVSGGVCQLDQWLRGLPRELAKKSGGKFGPNVLSTTRSRDVHMRVEALSGRKTRSMKNSKNPRN